MKKQNSTKKTLLSSVIALMLCIAMLIGTTFAWFTDSVTSANNRIQSGNLEVDLLMDKTEDGNYVSIADGEGDIFSEATGNGILWEPGKTEIVYLAVANLGSLALKYNIVLDITDNGLASALEYAVLDEVKAADVKAAATSWADITAYAGAQVDDMPTGKVIAAPNGWLEAGDDAINYFALAVHMKEEAGNEYQDKDIEIDVLVQATQATVEEDSFDNMYDQYADYDGQITNATSMQVAFTNGGTYKVEADFTVPTNGIPEVPEGSTVVIDLNGHTITAEDPEGKYALYNLGNLTIFDSKAATTYSMRSSNAGSIVARGIYNGYSKDGKTVPTAKITVLNGVYNAKGTNGGAAIFNYGVAEIKGGTFTSVGGYALNNQADAQMTVANASVTGGIYNMGKVTIDDSTVYQHISGRHAVYNWEAELVINSGSFDSASGNELILADGQDSKVVINGGTFDKTAKSWLFGAATGKNISFVINGGVFNGYVNKPENTVDTIRPYGDPIVVNGGTFNFDPTKWLADGYQSVEMNGAYVAVPEDYTLLSAGLFQNGQGDYIVTTGEGLATLNAKWKTYPRKALTIRLGADIDFAGYTWKTVDSHVDSSYGYLKEFDGQGYVIKNFTVQGQAMFRRFAGTGDVTIKNITFDNANVNSNGSINTSILVGQSYQNVLLDNVDVVNSTIIGGYKVAPLMGTVYNESASTITATLKNCDVKDTVVKSTTYDYFTTGMVSFVYAGDNDKIVFENCTISNVSLYGNTQYYDYHAFVYCDDKPILCNEVEGVTVTGCTFESLK